MDKLPDCPICKAKTGIDGFATDSSNSWTTAYIECDCDETPLLIEDRMERGNLHKALEAAWGILVPKNEDSSDVENG